MKKKFFLAVAFYSHALVAQNLISNPGFETFSALPVTYGEFNLATGWENCSGGGTPDYFNTAGTVGNYFGMNLPHMGDGMAGLCPYHGTVLGFREYLSTPLSTPMVAGLTYEVSFWLASGVNGGYGYGCNNVGVAFSQGPLVQTGSGPILLAPQVEITTVFYDTNWTQFSFQFPATAAYDYFTIGNFRDDASTTAQQFGVAYDAVYYFVDDIVVQLSNQPPLAVFNAPHHICPGTCTDFTNLSVNATSYLWTFGGATPSTSTDVNPVNICYNTPGSYSVSLIATNAITSDTLTLSNYITVYPYPPPQGILQSGDTLIANQGSVSYQWYYNGSLIPAATEYFYIAPQSGDYNVVCTDANGCEVEAVIFSVIADLPSPDSFRDVDRRPLTVFLNPVAETLSVISYELITTAVEISIYNMLGERIYLAVNRIPMTVDCRPFPPGMYWLTAGEGGKIYRVKFLKL
jgi:PKD repeat protein